MNKNKVSLVKNRMHEVNERQRFQVQKIWVQKKNEAFSSSNTTKVITEPRYFPAGMLWIVISECHEEEAERGFHTTAKISTQ